MPNQNRPVTEEDYERVRELHALRMGRNEIAREIGRAQRTVSVIAQELGLVFDTTMTEDATRARVAQLAEKRAILADALTDDALKLTEQVWAPALIYNFGGKDNTYEYREVDEPPAIDKKALMTAAGIAVEKSLKLVPPTDDAGADDARSMLGQLMRGLKSAYEEAGGEEAEGESP
ncbi:hypothetical protein [Streptomyces albicerus]|uniref:hypothetical protein n=1 Tax=Streptomyces albicerus TaxID=2569859 RepID=UPI00124B1B51|nr:hypothetical protein [Streptomyces albicerus]